MNSKLVKASLAGAAAIALAAGGSTFAAFSDYGNVTGNSVGAGILKLDLGAAGTGQAPLSFGDIAPGHSPVTRAIWVASSDGASVPNANLAVTFKDLVDSENGCSTLSESDVDTHCADANDPGELSKVVDVGVDYYPQFTDPAHCTTDVASWPAYNAMWAAHEGDLPPQIGVSQTLKQLGSSTTPLVLTPGQGVCLAVSVYWPKTGNNNPTATPDNAAQGDSFTFNARFDLTQV